MESGTKLAHYTISSLIGKGGMGEIYRAKDEKLGRQVAIKVLPEEFAKDADRLARFEREAKLLASLNHPNIAAIYGLEEHGGARFLVLELVEGPTLGDRFKQGAIPVEESLKLALQIAEALEAAHENGVIHRDLKPDNIKVTPDGKVKVLDFGLAKAFEGDVADVSVSNSPTLSMAATQQGIILGTAAYMSPEQASGEATDKRADIWSFGVVLFEMLTGRQMFTGKNTTHILADVIRAEPEWNSLPVNLHPRLRLLIERCLEKESKDRLSGISDARVDIERVLSDPEGVLVQPVAAVVQATPQSKLPWVAATALTATIVGLIVWFLTQPGPQPPVRLTAVHPGTEVPGLSFDTDVALSSDGTRLVYATGGGREGRIYVRALDELEPTLLVEAGRSLSLSPDGQWVGFVSGGTLSKVAINGGPTVPIASINGAPRGTAWGPDDTIVVATASADTGLFSVSAAGGEIEVLTTPDSETGELDHLWPSYLPDTNAVLFTITNNQGIDNSQIAVLDLDTGEYQILIQGGSNPLYAASGHIVYGVAGTLRAVPFDLDSLEVRGTPVPVLEDVVTKQSGAASFSVSLDGTFAYIAANGPSVPERTLVWVDREGNEEALSFAPANYGRPRVSPDGTRVALHIGGPDGPDVWIGELARGTLSRLTTTPGVDNVPLWTLDGEHVVFATGREQSGQLSFFQGLADGTGTVENLLTSEASGTFMPWGWSPDGMSMIFTYGTPPGLDIGLLMMESDESWQPLFQTEANEETPALSPDGSWVAYVSDQTGQSEVYVE